MDSSNDLSRAPAAQGVRTALVVAVAGSAMAALVHAAAVGGHEGDRILVWMFSLCAAGQLGWAVAAAVRPTRAVLALGLVVNGGAVLVWALSRTVGISFIESLADREVVGTQDLVAALFAAASVVAALCILARPTAPRRRLAFHRHAGISTTSGPGAPRGAPGCRQVPFRPWDAAAGPSPPFRYISAYHQPGGGVASARAGPAARDRVRVAGRGARVTAGIRRIAR